MGKFCLSDSLCFRTENVILMFITVLVVLFFIQNTAKQYNNVLITDVYKKQNRLVKLQNKLNSLENKFNIIDEKVVFEERIADPLIPPLQTYEGKYTMRKSPGMLVNIPTRGYVPNFQQIGVLHPETEPTGSGEPLKNILPLFGKPTYPGSQKWQYYTNSNGFNPLKLPVSIEGKNCLDDYGCKQLYDVGEGVTVQGAGNQKYKVGALYKFDSPRYIPYI